MSVLMTCKIQIAGGLLAAHETFDAFREHDLTQVGNDLILWNMRPAYEAGSYLIDVEAEFTEDADEAKALFATMVEETKPSQRGIAFGEPEVVQNPPSPGL